MNKELENKLWSRSIGSEQEWNDVIQYLISGLSTMLGQEVALQRIDLLDLDAFSCAIRGRHPVGGGLQIEWCGVLGMEPIKEQSLVTASLFVFSMGHRIQVAGQSGSTIDFHFEQRPDGPGEWVCLGWKEDVYGEWEAVQLD